MSDGCSLACPECGDPYVGGPGCYAGACAAEPDEPFPATTEINVASVNSAANVLREYIARESPDMVPLLFNADYEGMAMALYEAGRLLPPDTDTHTEYAVRMTWDDGSVTYGQCDRRRAEVSVAYHAKRRAEGPWRTVSAEVVERTVITSVGPWRPVPTTPPDGD